jgi:hypothetical protein
MLAHFFCPVGFFHQFDYRNLAIYSLDDLVTSFCRPEICSKWKIEHLLLLAV